MIILSRRVLWDFLRVCLECFSLFLPFGVDRKVKGEREKFIRATKSFRAFTLVNFAFFFSAPKTVFLSLFLLFSFVQCDIIDCASLDFLCVIITTSPFIQCESPCEEKYRRKPKTTFSFAFLLLLLSFFYFTSGKLFLLLL